MKKNSKKSNVWLGSLFSVSALSLAVSSIVYAQGDVETIAVPTQAIEEMMVLGRLRSSAQDRVAERMEMDIAVDILGSEQMTRIGDSTAAVALKRVPGVTLVDGKYVYVRGLGERYSSSLLNGATVPSPDLTRNVLPLDIFPASIIESIAVQKAYSAKNPATFGGGNIDIRTNGIPQDVVIAFELSGGIHSLSEEGLSYSGGSDDNWGEDDGTRALSSGVASALNTFFPSIDASEPSVSPDSIQATFARAGSPVSDAQAADINTRLASSLYRNLSISTDSHDLSDKGFSLNLGNRYDIGGDFQFGVLATADYDSGYRTNERVNRIYNDPAEEFKESTRTTHNVSATGTLNFGVSWSDEHLIESKNMVLRNTDDEVSIAQKYNTTASYSTGQGFQEYDFRYEQRELNINQITGSHRYGYDTSEALGLELSFIDDLEFDWFFSDATATTDIPSETNIEASISRNLETNAISAARLVRKQRMVDVRYTDLDDTVESRGFELRLPINTNTWAINLTGGGKYDRKTRTYEQLDLSIGPDSSAADASLLGGSSDLSTILSDDNIAHPEYGYQLIYQDGLSRSYVAATTTDAFFGTADFFWNDTVRMVLGARYEDYKQFSGAYYPYRVKGNRIDVGDVTHLETGEVPSSLFRLDDVYPSLALTYSRQDFWADDFNLRFSASETVVLPDLREIAPASYQDPLTGNIVSGNPDAIQSGITHLDFRAEWFFSSGDNLTLSLFHKDIQNPLEYFLDTGTEDSLNATIENAESGVISGIEAEWLSHLGTLNDNLDAFFIAGNVTLADSELIVGDDIEVSVTNRVRPLRGASEYVANIQLGYDSDDGAHAATVVYNVAGERIYSAGVGDDPDAYEQPFSAVDFSYSYFPTDNWTIKLKARNLLGESVVIQQGDVDIFEQAVGRSYSVSVKYKY